jgi:hypothetical protein
MKIYQIVIHISALWLVAMANAFAQSTDTMTYKYEKLYHVQQKYLNWIDKKDREFPFGLPVIAGNKYDEFQVGAALINLRQPVKNVDFTGVLLYGAKSKKVNGIADIAYYIEPENEVLNKIKIAANFKSFSNTAALKYYALKPELEFQLFSKKNASITHKINFRSNLIFEQEKNYFLEFNYNNDSTLKRFYANELTYTFERQNKNYPFSCSIQLEQAKQFLKMGIEANAFIRYQLKTYNTGLHLRFFSGAFLHRNSQFRPRLFANYGYTLSGTTGINDYKYNDLYFGRNERTGFAANQISNGNGYMKFISPAEQSYQEGRTVNYLLAMNIVLDFPVQYVPVKLFIDFGYSSDKQVNIIQNLPYNQFYYDAGLMFSFFNRGLEFYLPFIVSKEIRELNKTYRPKFKQRISFMLDIEKIALHKEIRKMKF